MLVHLDCLAGQHQGRQLTITPAKPLVIKTQKSDTELGEVVVEIKDDQLQLVNQSRMLCLVNEEQRQRSILADGDKLVIGKQIFKVVIEGSDNASTEPVAVADKKSLAEKVACSVCDAMFTARDHQHGYVRGNQRICFACLSKGVKPDHLPRTQFPTPPPGLLKIKTEDLEPLVPVKMPSREPPTEPIEAPKQVRSHRSKRISASQPAMQRGDSDSKTRNLFAKVSGIFGRGDKKANADRLKELEDERAVLLREAGRLSLTEQGGPNIPDRYLDKVIKGIQVILQLQDFSISALELWRSQRQRLAFLDAEIAALRRKLNLDPDAEPHPRMSAKLRAEQQALQERAFEAMDGLMTEEDLAAKTRTDEIETEIQAQKPKPAPGKQESQRTRKVPDVRRRRRR